MGLNWAPRPYREGPSAPSPPGPSLIPLCSEAMHKLPTPGPPSHPGGCSLGLKVQCTAGAAPSIIISTSANMCSTKGKSNKPEAEAMAPVWGQHLLGTVTRACLCFPRELKGPSPSALGATGTCRGPGAFPQGQVSPGKWDLHVQGGAEHTWDVPGQPSKVPRANTGQGAHHLQRSTASSPGGVEIRSQTKSGLIKRF